MKAEQMWETSTGEGVTVAVIDTGVDDRNGDLRGQVLDGLDLAPDEPGDEHTDYEGHGTGMAGIIAGTGESGGGDGAFGLAPGVKILPVRVRDGEKVNGTQGAVQFPEDLAKGLRFAADHGARVINVSMANDSGSPELTKAVQYARSKGALIFAGAGNNAELGNALQYPAAIDGVVGMGAIGKDLQASDFSQHGPAVDLAAPGDEMVYACGGKTGICTGHGTSAATAVASASAALIWAEHPDWTNNQVLRVLLRTAGKPTSGAERNDYIGYGVVRPRIALTEPGDPGPADEYPLPDLVAAQSPAPSTEESKGAAGADGSRDDAEQASPAPAAAEAGDGAGPGLWIGLGIGAAVVIGAGVAFAVSRSRRNAAPTAFPPGQVPAPAHQASPYQGHQQGHQPPYSEPPHAYPGAQPPQAYQGTQQSYPAPQAQPQPNQPQPYPQPPTAPAPVDTPRDPRL
ncbi:type VII secretion-associated serine protease mycosin [uncultured Streptomyces sp.]|uniref:type VII secretion-associated serine protease mycosin n=1 Tax=uncultured Streptomyces sp. TaxID=174707 RepID=UPI00261D0075|nr:type VII secretion-associated serine protease mycosin [uncultured Streptomyces sp.]